MTKFMANTALLILGVGCMLGNMRFTYGLWPKSWGAFFGFALASIILVVIRMAVEKED